MIYLLAGTPSRWYEFSVEYDLTQIKDSSQGEPLRGTYSYPQPGKRSMMNTLGFNRFEYSE